MATAINLGFPRIGANRELKNATESYWAGKSSQESLLAVAREIRKQNWTWQRDAGLDQVPTGDFSFYDHVLDTAFWLDAIPKRFRPLIQTGDLDTYFAMARGSAGTQHGSVGSASIPAMEMTKWFDTNYHYLVPEFAEDQEFRLARNTAVELYREAAGLGLNARPVLLGPISFLLLGKTKHSSFHPLSLLERVIPAYQELLQRLASEGATWVQIDEPVLALDLEDSVRAAFSSAFERLSQAAPSLKILLAAYFGSLRDNLDTALRLPIAALHLDLVRGPDQLEPALKKAPEHLALSLGVVDGRNIWKTDLDHALAMAEQAAARLSSERIMVGPSCSLLHVPVDLIAEKKIAPEIRGWLAFGRQKLDEIVTIKRALNEGREAVRAQLDDNRESLRSRRNSPLVLNPAIRERLNTVKTGDFKRQHSFPIRQQQQQDVLNLPLLPTTTIGSFPQTPELRRQRARLRKHEISAEEYDAYIRKEIAYVIEQQEKLNLDVLVHGEAERNDMVEYFGELLSGFAFTENGWVQSYGSRCVKPPIIYGDVMRPGPMTVDWWKFAQSQTKRPVKGMLTGPVTILQWSFVRNDQSRKDTCFQLALAIRDETIDLETAGCKVIQIDEPALREGLPLRHADASEYLQWAVDAFRLSSAGVKDTTQIHTHMCYAEFNEIVKAVSAMDADVISIESARSQMESLEAFTASNYQNGIGPGVYDIHSPRIPPEEEMVTLLEKAIRVIPRDRLWVNPDCGLKTRRWEEVSPALERLVAAAERLRRVH